MTRVNIPTLVRMTGRSDATWRRWLKETPPPLDIQYGRWMGGTHKKRGRVMWLDLEEARQLHLARGGTDWHEEYLPAADLESLRAEVAALGARVAALEGGHALPVVGSVAAGAPAPIKPVQAAALVTPAEPVEAVTPVTPTRTVPRVMPRDPLRVPAWLHSSRRSHPLYTAYWKLDSRMAQDGLINWVIFGRMCGVPHDKLQFARQRDTSGELPKGRGLTSHRVGVGSRSQRYLDAVQRAAWLDYFQSLNYVKHVPTEAEIQDALDELASWGGDAVEVTEAD